MECGKELMVYSGPKSAGARKLLSGLTLAVSLPVIILLAIPTCLMILAIGLVWSLADEALKRLDEE